MNDEVVWLTSMRRFAFLVSRNAYFSVVTFDPDGTRCFLVDNDDYEIWSERAIEFESDE